MILELPLVFAAGFLGSSHCLGMCGPFALALGSGGQSWRGNLARQTLYTGGRVFTYAFLGAVAGFAGGQIQGSAPLFVNAAGCLAIVAGLFLVYQGLAASGLSLIRPLAAGNGPCLAGGILAHLIRSPRSCDVFLAGLFTGFIPCGLVYAFVAIAASSGTLPRGVLLMVAFGLGTAPLMLLAGCGGSLLNLAFRKHLFRIAAWCVVLTGLVTVARGFGAVLVPGVTEAGIDCPLCP